MNKKYEFTGEEKQVYGRTLKRIKAKISFGNIISGEIGGWIEKEENLSHNGNAWVYGNAEVCGDAEVYGDAKVCGDAEVIKTTHIISFSRVGSRNDTLTAFRTKTAFSIKVGCFLGSLELFLEKVKETHRDNKYAEEYKAIAEVIKIRFKNEGEE